MSLMLSGKFRFSELEGGGVLLDLANGEYWQLNELGARVVSWLVAGWSPHDMIQELMAQHPEEASRVPSDVTGMVEQLRGIGAIVDE